MKICQLNCMCVVLGLQWWEVCAEKAVCYGRLAHPDMGGGWLMDSSWLCAVLLPFSRSDCGWFGRGARLQLLSQNGRAVDTRGHHDHLPQGQECHRKPCHSSVQPSDPGQPLYTAHIHHALTINACKCTYICTVSECEHSEVRWVGWVRKIGCLVLWVLCLHYIDKLIFFPPTFSFKFCAFVQPFFMSYSSQTRSWNV